VAEPAVTPQKQLPSRWSSPRSIANELLPPVITRVLRRSRAD
jgi:hypothetical protein